MIWKVQFCKTCDTSFMKLPLPSDLLNVDPACVTLQLASFQVSLSYQSSSIRGALAWFMFELRAFRVPTMLNKAICGSWIFCCFDKTLSKSNLRKKGLFFCLAYNSSLRKVRSGIQGRDLEARKWSRDCGGTQPAYWLNSAWFQDYLPRGHTIPTSVISQ